jgi:hypothetical protein
MLRSIYEASALHLEDPQEHWMCLRLSSKSFDTLLTLIIPYVQCLDSFITDATSARIK